MSIPKEPFFSYSYIAEKEDLILYHALKDIKKGFYIDVGACSSIDGSVTKALYDRGWCGINIEPQQAYYMDLQKNRPRDINLNIGVSNGGNELMLYGQGALATFSEQIVKYHCEVRDTDGEVFPIGKVATQPLSEICARYLPHEQGKPISVHFCKIDVEGFEREVLLSHDYQNYRPWIFVVEATLPNSDIPSYDKWEYILLDNGYEFALSYNSNRYYVDRCRTDIIECLRAITGEEYLSRHYDIFHVDSRRVDNSRERILISQLFIDEGKGFTETHKIISESNISDEKIYTVRFDLSDYHIARALRFDPLEGHYCEMEILSAKDAHGAVYPEPQASIRSGKADRFLSTDPQYLIASPCENFLEIRFRLRILSLFEAEQAVYSYVWHQSKQFTQQEDQIGRQAELIEQLNTQVGTKDALLSQQRAQMEWQDGQIGRQTELIGYLNTQVGTKDTILNQQRELIDWQEGQISRQAELIEQLNTQIGTRDTLLSQQRERMEWQEGQISRQAELIEQLNTQIGTRDTLLSQQRERMEWQEGQIGRQAELMEQLNTQIGAQDALLGQQRERMEWQEGQIDRQAELIEQLNTQIGAQDALLSQQRKQMEQQEGQIENLLTQLEELQNSVYWKMTTPFRVMHNCFKRVRKGNR